MVIAIIAILASLSTAILAAEVDLRDYGAVGDGVANDTTPLSNALDAVVGGGVLTIPAGTYRIVGNLSKTLTGNVRIVGSNNAVLQLEGSGLVLQSASINSALVNAVTRGQNVIRVNSDAAFQVGHVVYITSNIDAETAWGYNKMDTHLITAVTSAGNGQIDVTLDTPLNFSYNPADTG
ncbi:MAG TPA: glycosyl hydrolase family 28-related protein, partial [Armatimonadota bacterium]